MERHAYVRLRAGSMERHASMRLRALRAKNKIYVPPHLGLAHGDPPSPRGDSKPSNPGASRRTHRDPLSPKGDSKPSSPGGSRKHRVTTRLSGSSGGSRPLSPAARKTHATQEPGIKSDALPGLMDSSVHMSNVFDGFLNQKRMDMHESTHLIAKARSARHRTQKKSSEDTLLIAISLTLESPKHHLETESSFSQNKSMPQAIGMDQWKKRWDHMVNGRLEDAGEPDEELEGIEAELYADIRERRSWPKSTGDPRPGASTWRDRAWAPLERGAGPDPTKPFVAGQKPWIPLAEEPPLLHEPPEISSRKRASADRTSAHARLAATGRLDLEDGEAVPESWPTAAVQWVKACEDELSYDLQNIKERRERQRGGGQTPRRPAVGVSPYVNELLT